MKEYLYKATIEIAFLSAGNAEAEDKVSAIFTMNLMREGIISDWKYYYSRKGEYKSPVPMTRKQAEKFDELPEEQLVNNLYDNPFLAEEI